MKKLQIAIVGCGDIARFTALACRLNRKIQVVACVDMDMDKAASFARRFGIKQYYDSYEKMLDQATMDVVYLAVPHYLHFPMIKTALEKGLHVFCEKPITIKLEDAFKICQIAKEKRCKVGVNYQYRYDKACYSLSNASNNGDLGEIYYARCNVPWKREDDYFSKAKWHSSLEQAGGGTLLTQASHIVDISLLALNEQPIAAFGVSRKLKFKDVEVEDLHMGTIEMSNGALLQVTSSMVASPEQPISIEIYGSKGTGIYRGSFLFPKVSFLGTKVKKAHPPVKGIHALFASIEGFRRWIVLDEPYLMPIEESLPVLATIEALYKSSETGNKETIDNRYLEFNKPILK